MTTLTGIVKTGLGEGAYYVKEYNPFFRAALGEEFFPGTLDIIVKNFDPRRFREKAVRVVPDGKEGLFPVHCIKTKINNSVNGYIILPTKNKHGKDVVELMATINLRERFQLKDGDTVEVEVI